MRPVLRRFAVLVVAFSLAGGVAGAGVGVHAAWFVWNGSAIDQQLSFAYTVANGFHLVDSENEGVVWGQACEDRLALWPVRAGSAVLCSPKYSVLGGWIDDANPDNSALDCTGTVSAKPGYPFPPIGGTVLGKILKPLDGAPIGPLGLVVRQGGSTSTGICSGFGFWSPGGFKSFNMGGVAGPWPKRTVIEKKWTDVRETGTSYGFESFIASLTSDASESTNGDPEETSTALGWSTLWLEKATQGNTGPIAIQAPEGGLLDVFAAEGDPITVFTIHQKIHRGKNRLLIHLTRQGRTYLLHAPAPRLHLKIAFTPSSRARQTLRTTLTPPLIPTITSTQFGGTPANPTIAVKGRELSPLPAPDPAGTPVGHNGCPPKPGAYGSDYGATFNLEDLTGGWSAGLHLAATNVTSCIGIIPTKVSPGEVDFRLGSFYTSLYPQFKLSPGDQVELLVNGAPAEINAAYGPPIKP